MFYEDVFRALNDSKVKYAVAGGVAVNLHGYVRFTADLDLIVHLENENIDKFFTAIEGMGYIPRVPVTKNQFMDEAIREEWIRLKHMQVFSFFHNKEYLNVIDIFVKEPISFDVIEKNILIIKVKDIDIPVLSLEHLIALKEEANRPKDLIDITNLKTLKQ